MLFPFFQFSFSLFQTLNPNQCVSFDDKEKRQTKHLISEKETRLRTPGRLPSSSFTSSSSKNDGGGGGARVLQRGVAVDNNNNDGRRSRRFVVAFVDFATSSSSVSTSDYDDDAKRTMSCRDFCATNGESGDAFHHIGHVF